MVHSSVEVGYSCRISQLVLSIFSKPCYGDLGAQLYLENPQAGKRVTDIYEDDTSLFLISEGSKTTPFHPPLLSENL